MKKIILLLAVIFSLTGCSVNDDNNNSYTYHVLPVHSYELPESYEVGETYEIILKYQRPTACHIYQGIYYDKQENTRIIAIQTVVDNNQLCAEALPPLSETKFNFKPIATGTYLFKFYKGKDTDEKDIFEEVEFQVVE